MFRCDQDSLLTTSLFLPLKSGFTDDFYSALLNDVIDPMVLMTTNKIKQLSATHSRSGSQDQTTSFRCTPCARAADAEQVDRVIDSGRHIDLKLPDIKCRFVPELCNDVQLSINSPKGGTAVEPFRVYHVEFNVPRHCGDPTRPNVTDT